ncbi:putative nucleoporin, Nup133/Nup155, N-terminal [Trichophyton rubrum]|nr:putative nucleoporin, Nup133/Nup155, N-terminal [Trichophyton rubrum]
MFSAQGGIAVTAVSSRPRRRQRPRSEDGFQPPRAKRQRSTKHAEAGGDTELDTAAYEQAHCLAVEPVLEDGPSLAAGDTSIDLPVRGRKESDRPTYDSHSTLILDNGFYSATRLSALPEPLQRSSAPFRCVVSPEHANSLILTHNQVYVWAYSSGSSSISPSDFSTFNIPEPSPKHIDPLPLGAFTSSSSTSDAGMLVVIPATGKITFWQTISNNVILGLIKQKCNTVHGSIPGMMSGEFVTGLLNAEPSGFIITLSTGRVAHLTIMDAHGKASLNIRFLDLANRATSGGIFGGLRNVFSGASWRRNIAAANGGRSTQRGQREVIIATSSGLIEVWDIHWNNGSGLKTRMDATLEINRALKDKGLNSENGSLASVQVLDFAIKNNSKRSNDAERDLSLWVLFSVSGETISYFVVDLTFPENIPEAGRVFKIDYEGQLQDSADSTPKIYVPRPGKSAFIVFKNATVLVSLIPVEDSTKDGTPEFQDLVRLRDRDNFVVIGSTLDDCGDEHRRDCCVLVIQNYGLVHLSSLRLKTEVAQDIQLTTKLRLEQIVFFENAKDNPINFHHYKELSSKPRLEEAILNITDEILHSSSMYISSIAASLEHQMTMRSNALQALAKYIRNNHVELSYSIRWQLLWNAEKMAASKAIWALYNDLKKKYPEKDLYLGHLIETMGEKFKSSAKEGDGPEDPIRHWFIYDTWQMEHIIPWIMNGIRVAYNKPQSVTRDFIDKVWQASEISLAALETAFSFRRENAHLYGIDDISLALKSPQCAELSEFWTSLDVNYDETENLLDTELNTCIQWMRQLSLSGRTDAEDSPAKALEKNLSRQFAVFSQIYKERRQLCAVSEDRQVQNDGKLLEKAHRERRKPQLYKMAAIGHLEEAVTLAENFHDMTALVELMVEVHDKIDQKHPQKAVDRAIPGPREEAVKQWRSRIDSYFTRYGEPWADAFFTRQITAGQPAMLLIMREYKDDVTRFLRKTPGYGKLSWMNEVLGERNYDNAAKILTELATQHETNLWSKRVELALAKLSTLAARETQTGMQVNLSCFEDETELATIQESVYDNLPHLNEAIDESARLQIANDQFANVSVQSKPALRETLQRALAKLVTRCPVQGDELADLLTLMDPIPAAGLPEENEVAGHEFSLALRALNLSGSIKEDGAYRENLEKIVWRRCMIRDDWERISATAGKTDDEVEADIRSTALFKTIVDYTNGLGFDGESNHLHRPTDILDRVDVPHKLVARLLPEQRGHLSTELDDENSLLKHYIEKGNLEHWFSWIIEHGVPEIEQTS